MGEAEILYSINVKFVSKGAEGAKAAPSQNFRHKKIETSFTIADTN